MQPTLLRDEKLFKALLSGWRASEDLFRQKCDDITCAFEAMNL